MTPDNDHTAGNGHQSIHTRFQKGKSGNPKGRPKGSKNFSTAMMAELNQRVDVTESGSRRKVQKRAVIAKQLVNKSAAGDLRAMPMVLSQISQLESRDGASELIVFSEEDRKVLQEIYERMRIFKEGENNA
jgi:hypothetical protein